MICSQLLRRLAFAGLTLSAAPLFAADFTSTWTGGSATWDTVVNWSTPGAPGTFPNNGVSTYDAVINFVGPADTVTLNTNITVEDLLLSSANATVNHTSGTFAATGGINLASGIFQLNGGTISNTVISGTSGALTISSSTNNRLDGVTVAGTMTLSSGFAKVRLQNGAVLNGTVNLNADTNLVGAASVNVDGGSSATVGSSGLVRGEGSIGSNTAGVGTNALTNQGTIQADVANHTLSINGDSFTNTGVLKAMNGGTLRIQPGAFNDQGTIEALTGSVINVPNGYTQTAGVTRVSGGTITSPAINIVSGTLEGTGTINAAVTSTGIINLDSGGTITGTLNATGGAWNGQGSVSGLVTAGVGTFTIGSGANLRANGGLNVTGVGTIAAASAMAKITGSVNYLSSSNSTFGGIIAGAGKTLTLNNAAATLTLAGASTYTGATTVTAGILKAGIVSVSGVSGAFGRNSAVVMANSASAMLDITGFDTQIGSLSGGGTSGGNVLLGAATLTFGGSNASPAVYDGTISGSGGIAKIGPGTQTLTGTNTYVGRTTVGFGTLRLDFASLATPTNILNSPSALTLGGGTLSVRGKTGAGVVTAQTLGDVTLSANTFSTIAPDPNNSGAGSTTLTLGNAWTRNPGSTLLIDYSSANTGTRLVRTPGVVTGTGAAGANGIFGYALVKDSGGTGFAKQDGSFNFVRNTTVGTVLTTSNSVAGTTMTDFTTVSADPGFTHLNSE